MTINVKGLGPDTLLRYLGLGLLALSLWFAIYWHLETFASLIVFKIAGFEDKSSLGRAVHFFFYDTPKIFLLLLLTVYVIGFLRAGLRTESIRDYLSGKGRGVGYILGAGFGAVTPFCSCSSIPLFFGFTMAKIPLGITMAFLVTSPLVNEIAVVLLWGLLGWKFTLIYVVLGIFSGIVCGIIMDAARAERYLQPFLLEAREHGPSGSAFEMIRHRMTLIERHTFAVREVVSIFRRVWLWVIIGVGLGAVMHGYVPEDWFAENLGKGQAWSVPLAVGLGIPLYSNVSGIVPVMESLLLKGLPLGTTLAFCMSVVAASLPELMLLKQVMQWRLLAAFFVMLLVLFTVIGWIFNLLTL